MCMAGRGRGVGSLPFTHLFFQISERSTPDEPPSTQEKKEEGDVVLAKDVKSDEDDAGLITPQLMGEGGRGPEILM